MRVLDPGSGSLNYAVLKPPCQAMPPGLHGQGNAPTQTRLQGQEIVMGTFGSNHIYTVGRVVKVEDLMRWRFPPRGFDSLRISMQNSSNFDRKKFGRVRFTKIVVDVSFLHTGSRGGFSARRRLT